MSRSERLFTQVRQFRLYVVSRSRELDEQEADIQDMKGSERYNTLMAKIKSDRENLMREAREKYGAGTDAILAAMLKAAETKTPTEAPTTEALNMLQALKIRVDLDSPISRDELQGAVASFGDNPVIYNALKEIAKKNGVLLQPPKDKGINGSQAQDAVKALANNISGMFHLPKLGARKEWADAMYGNNHSAFNDSMGAIRAFRLDIDFRDTNDFLQTYTMLPPDQIEQFKNIIDAE